MSRGLCFVGGLTLISALLGACTLSPELARKPVNDFNGLTVGQAVATIQALQYPPFPTPTLDPTVTPVPPTPVPPTPTPTEVGSVDPETCFRAVVTRGYYVGTTRWADISLSRLPPAPGVEGTCGTKALVRVIQVSTETQCATALEMVAPPTYRKTIRLPTPQCGSPDLLALWTSRQAALTAAYESAYRDYLNEEILVQPRIEDYTLTDMAEIRNEIVTRSMPSN